MAIIVRVNGIDLRDAFGVVVERFDGLRSLPRRRLMLTTPLRSAGSLAWPTAPPGRDLTLSGVLIPEPRTIAARDTAELGLADLLEGGLLEIERDDGSAPRVIEGVLTGLVMVPSSGRASRVTMQITCLEAWWRSPEPTIRHLITAGSRYPLPLGNAPSRPIWVLQGDTSANPPVLTVRNAGGTVLWQTTVGALASDEWYELDTVLGIVWKVAGGVSTRSEVDLAGASPAVWSQPLDPQDGDYRTSQWPTAEVSHGSASVTYWKAWL